MPDDAWTRDILAVDGAIGHRLRDGLSDSIADGSARGRAHGITEPASPAAEAQIAEYMQIK